MTDSQQEIRLGEGRLTWPPDERVGDRYGVVLLMADGDSLNEPIRYIEPLSDVPLGALGSLVADVLETRHSTHIGDLFRGFYPETPAVGERIILGTGRFFTELTRFGTVAIGLEPEPIRHVDWLNPKALYRAHEQTVRLSFIPGGVL